MLKNTIAWDNPPTISIVKYVQTDSQISPTLSLLIRVWATKPSTRTAVAVIQASTSRWELVDLTYHRPVQGIIRVVVSIMWYIFMTICCHFRYLYASDRTTGSFKYFGMCRPKLGSFVCSHIGFKISILLRNYS